MTGSTAQAPTPRHTRRAPRTQQTTRTDGGPGAPQLYKIPILVKGGVGAPALSKIQRDFVLIVDGGPLHERDSPRPGQTRKRRDPRREGARARAHKAQGDGPDRGGRATQDHETAARGLPGCRARRGSQDAKQARPRTEGARARASGPVRRPRRRRPSGRQFGPEGLAPQGPPLS